MVLDKFGESFKSEFLELVREVVTDGHRATWRHLSCAYVVVTPCSTASVGPPVKTRKNYPFKNVVAASEVSLYSVLLHWRPAAWGGRTRSGVCCRSSRHRPGSRHPSLRLSNGISPPAQPGRDRRALPVLFERWVCCTLLTSSVLQIYCSHRGFGPR